MSSHARLDGPFWVFLLVILCAGLSLCCFALAMTHSRTTSNAEILSTDNCPPPPDL